MRLILETTLRGITVALADASAPASDVQIKMNSAKQSSADFLVAFVQDLLQTAKITTKDLEAVLVSHGPGSFTGIRIGLAYAYGMHLADPNITMLGCNALQEACAYLCKNKPLMSGGILIPQTRTHGFCSFMQDGKISTELVAYDTDRFSFLLNHWQREHYSIYTPLPMQEWPSQRDCFQSIEWEQLALWAVHGMATIDLATKTTSLPKPLYMRLSTAEERTSQGEAHGGQ